MRARRSAVRRAASAQIFDGEARRGVHTGSPCAALGNWPDDPCFFGALLVVGAGT